MDYETFLNQFEAHLRTIPELCAVERVGNTFRVHAAGDRHVSINPCNFWRQVNSGHSDPASIIRQAITVALEAATSNLEQPWEAIADRVFARLERHDLANRAGQYWRLWMGSRVLHECLVEDRTETMRRITTSKCSHFS